jgi:hypothetical protein
VIKIMSIKLDDGQRVHTAKLYMAVYPVCEHSWQHMRSGAPASSAVPCCTSPHATLRCSSAMHAKYRLRNSTLQQTLVKSSRAP